MSASSWHCLIACILVGDVCSREPEVAACVFAEKNRDPRAAELCEQAWQDTRDEAAAISGAYHALRKKDDASLQRWARRARPTLEGAKILHFWGQRQLERRDLDGAEATLTSVLRLRIDRDPLKAINTAY